MGLNPKSSWPRSLWQKHYYCQMCGGPLTNTCEIQFDSGSVEPTEDETLTGATSGDTGVVSSVTLESGTWAGGDAVGTVYLTSPSGQDSDGNCFDDDETVTGSTGGADMLTVKNDGIIKSEGIPYPESEIGWFEGKSYCQQHLAFKISRDKYKYRIDTGE